VKRGTKLPSTIPDHALIGTWVTEKEDSEAAFTFSARDNTLHVSGFCISDREEFEITKVKWDGKALSFTARMPSTETVTRHVFRIRRDGKLTLELTTYEVWKKRKAVGAMPAAWRRASDRPSLDTEPEIQAAKKVSRFRRHPAPTTRYNRIVAAP
jgi:hypothetical protein